MIKTVVGLCNQALTRLGASRIQSLEETSEPARLCNLLYEQTRDEVLWDYPWACALTRQRLAQIDPGDYGVEGENAYQLPQDPYCLRIVSVLDPELGAEVETWSVEGRVLYSPASEIILKYIGQIDDPGVFDSELAEAIVLKMATKLSVRLSGKANKEASFLQQYEYQLQKARWASGSQRPNPPNGFTWRDA